MSFSQRHGFKPLKTAIQTGSMDEDLRNGLWNVLSVNILHEAAATLGPYGTIPRNSVADALVTGLWRDHFKLTLDDAPTGWDDAYQLIKGHYFLCDWNEVYDLLEFLAKIEGYPHFIDNCNEVLERELSGYRFVGNLIAPITSEAELSAIEEALLNTEPILSVQNQLHQALAHFADRKAPDYRNSIKESISAVEGICKLIAGDPKATLGQALKVVDKRLSLHPSLKDAFLKLYSYTSDAQGIRHALMDEPNLEQEDAKFMLVACSGFINYLIAKASRAGIALERT